MDQKGRAGKRSAALGQFRSEEGVGLTLRAVAALSKEYRVAFAEDTVGVVNPPPLPPSADTPP